MKKIKVLLLLFVYIIVFLYIGESSVEYIESFSSIYGHIIINFDESMIVDDVIQDINTAAEENGVSYFLIRNDILGKNDYETKVFCGRNDINRIKQDSGLKKEIYKSILFDDIRITYSDLNELSSLKGIGDIYIIGSTENARMFQRALEKDYEVSRFYPGNVDYNKKSDSMTAWLILTLVNFIITYSDVILSKKEFCVRAINGESRLLMYLKNSFFDVGANVFAFTLAFAVTSVFTNPSLNFDVSIKLLVVNIICVLLINAKPFFIDYKVAFSNGNHSEVALLIMYLIKVLTLTITVVMITSNIVIFNDALDVYKQKSFVESYGEYKYVYLQSRYDMYETNEEFDEKFYKDIVIGEKLYRSYENESFLLGRITDLDENGFVCLLANKNAGVYLQDVISELKDYSLEEKVYILIPESRNLSDSEKTRLIESLKNYYSTSISSENIHFDVLHYKDCKLLYSNYFMKRTLVWADSPIILFENTSPNRVPISDITPNNYSHSVLYDVSDEEIKQFVQKNNFDEEIYNITRLNEEFSAQIENAKKEMIASFVFSGLIFTLNALVVYLILKFEYEVNAIELSIKKITGYGIIKRYMTIIGVSLFSTISSVVLDFLLMEYLQISQPLIMAFSVLTAVAVETILIILISKKLELTNIHQILKGGCL